MKGRLLIGTCLAVMAFLFISPDKLCADQRQVTLQWEQSIDAPYIDSYVLYYYKISGQEDSLNSSEYAASYQLPGEAPVTIGPDDPKPITIDKKHTQITLRFLNEEDYFFVMRSKDKYMVGDPTPEISTKKK